MTEISDEQIRDELIRRELARRARAEPMSRTEAGLRSGLHGLTFGGSDELTGLRAGRRARREYLQERAFAPREGEPQPEPITVEGSQSAFDAGYASGRDASRENLARAREQHPVTSFVSEIGGAIPTALLAPTLAPLRAGATVARLGNTAVTLGKTGAAMGNAAATAAGPSAIYGFNTGEGGLENRAANAGISAAVGGLTAAALPAVAAGLANRAQRTAVRQQAPSLDQLRAQSDEAFRAVREAGVRVSQPKFSGFVDDLTREASSGQGVIFRPKLHPRVADAFEEFDALSGGMPSLDDMHYLRRLLGQAGASQDPSERALASNMIDKLDEFVDGLTPRDVASNAPNPGEAVKAWRQGIETWGRMRRGEIIQDIVEKAELQASGFENGIVIGFRQLLRNPKRLRGFSKSEIGMMRQAVKRTSPQAVLRTLARLSPNRNITGVYGPMAVGGAASGALGVPAGAAASLGGRAVESLANRGARRTADLIGATVRSRGQIPTPPPSALQQMLTATPAAPAGVSGAAALSPDRLRSR